MPLYPGFSPGKQARGDLGSFQLTHQWTFCRSTLSPSRTTRSGFVPHRQYISTRKSQFVQVQTCSRPMIADHRNCHQSRPHGGSNHIDRVTAATGSCKRGVTHTFRCGQLCPPVPYCKICTDSQMSLTVNVSCHGRERTALKVSCHHLQAGVREREPEQLPFCTLLRTVSISPIWFCVMCLGWRWGGRCGPGGAVRCWVVVGGVCAGVAACLLPNNTELSQCSPNAEGHKNYTSAFDIGGGSIVGFCNHTNTKSLVWVRLSNFRLTSTYADRLGCLVN